MIRPDGNTELRALEEQNAQLLALFLASQRLASTLEPAAVRETILDILVEFTGAASVSLWLQDDRTGELWLTAARGLDGETPPKIGPGKGLIGGVAAGGEAVVIGEPRQDVETGLPILATVPLRLDSAIVGAVAVHALLPQKRGFDDADRELLHLIAGQAAPALTSARLYAESQGVLRGLRDLAHKTAARVADLEAVAQTTVEEVTSLLQADTCQLFLLDDETGQLVLQASGGAPDQAPGTLLRLGEDAAGQALAEIRVVRADPGTTTSGAANGETGSESRPLGQVMAVPLLVSGVPIGVLAVGRRAGTVGWDGGAEVVLDAAADQLAVGINNARLYARVEDDFFKMSTLFLAANRLHATLDLEEILRSARDILESLIGAQTYAIVLQDELTSELRVAVAEGISTLQQASFRAAVGEGLIGRVVQTGEPFIATATEPAIHRAFGQPVLACVPLRVEGMIIGAIVVNRLLPHKSGLIATDNELFAMLAQHAATAILAARLFARAEQKLVTLYDLSRLISASVSIDEIIGLTMRLVTQVMRVRVAAVFALDQEAGSLRLAHVFGLGLEATSIRVRPGEGAIGQAVALGEVFETEDASADPRFSRPLGFIGHGAVLVAPLKVGHAVAGALVIADRVTGGPFTQDDRQLASTLAGQVALIMQHTQLYQHAQHLAIILEREREALRKSNRELEMAHRQLDALVENLSDGVILVDTSGTILRTNATFRRLVYLAEGTTTFAEFERLNITWADGRPMVLEDWPVNRALRGESVSRSEGALTRPDGTRLVWEVSAEPIRDSTGEVVMAVAILRDIGAQSELDRQKDEFVATAAHELRSPVTALRGHTQLLIRQLERSTGREAELRGLRVIDAQSGRLVRLVDRLLDVSRLQLGRVDLERETMDLVQLAEQLVADMRIVVPDRRVEWNASVPSILGWWDRSRIEEVISNLLTNAAKFSPLETPIQVGVETRDGLAHLWVRDWGPGIPPDRLEQIFEWYAQVTGQKGAGLGLGLYVSRRIVEAHGGRIWAEAGPDGGAVFHVELPQNSAIAERPWP